MKKICLFLSVSALLGAPAAPQSHISTQPHQDAVSVIAAATGGAEKAYFSAGKDGFLVRWTDDDQGEHYQISELELKAAAVSPSGREIAVYETDGGAVNRVSVWDWPTLSRKYARRFSDSVTTLTYSAKGTYLIAGTATVDGAVFLRAATGEVVSKIKDSTGIVSYAATSGSEKTAVMYSPAGSLSYYSMAGGRMTNRFAVPQGLEQPVMFNNNLFLAGVSDGAVCVIYALSGKTVARVPASDPILLVSEDDTGLYYLENDGKGLYTLKVLENAGNRAVSNPRIVKTYRGPRGAEAVICGTKTGNSILLGSRSGEIYRADSEPDTATLSLYPVTEKLYDRILDMAPIGEDFYFLTRNAVFRSSYDSGVVNRLAENRGRTQIITYGDKAVLWSKGTHDSVQLLNFNTKELTDLFKPETTLQSVRLFGTTLVEMESNSVVRTFDLDGRKLKEVYSGAGLQDAVIAGDGRLYVAKSFATNPNSALLCVDMTTRETAPVPVNGKVAFALNCSGNDIYGISIQSAGNSAKTVVFRYNTATKQTATVLSLAEEDSDAFTSLHDPVLYTNIGKDKVRACNLRTRKNLTLSRSASMPVKAEQNASRVVVLNRDGSISWYNYNLTQVLADWYLTRDGQWYEF